MADSTLLQDHTRLSESDIWKFQLKFFENEGINAWHGQVPFYITCNPYIANCYVEVVLNFVLDYMRLEKYQQGSPFYIIEMGTGSGKFSYYFLKRLVQLQEDYNLQGVKIIYVMTDFTDTNIKYWQAHPQFQQFLESGILDFATFDLVNSENIHLINKDITLSEETIEHPLIVLGNYIFDSVQQDIFRVENKKLQEGKVRLTTEKEIKDKDNLINNNIPIDDIKVTIGYEDVTAQPYTDPIYNQILAKYQAELEEGSFIFPVGPYACITSLLKMSKNRLLLITSDKGYCHLSEIEGRSSPGIVNQSCFSTMVNYHAIGNFFQLKGGECWHQTLREGIKTSVFLMGDSFKALPLTRHSVRNFIDDFGPVDFFNFHKHLGQTKDTCSLKTIVSHMYFCHWDPRIFNLFIQKIFEELKSANYQLVIALSEGITKIIENVYEMPGAEESYFNIASFLHAIERNEQALIYYQKVLKLGGESFALLYNMALCYASINENQTALNYFKQAQKFNKDKDSKELRKWINWLTVKVQA